MKIFNLFLLLSLIVTEAIAETLLKKDKVFIGILLYSLVAYLFYLFLKNFKGSFSRANILWQSLNILLVTFVSILMFKTKLTIKQWSGIFMIVVGLILNSESQVANLNKS